MFDRDYTLTGKHATFLKFLAVKNSKEDVPPKRKEESNNFGEKLIVDKSKNDLNTDKIFDSDVLIYKSNNMNNQKDTKI